MVFVKYPKVRFKRPADTSCFCSRLILLTKFKSLFGMWHVYLILLTFINIIASKAVAVYFQLDPIVYDGNADSIITHDCLWKEFHLAFQPCSSVCECIHSIQVLQVASVTTTKPPSSMWLKSDHTCKFCSVSQEKHDFRSSLILFGLSFDCNS